MPPATDLTAPLLLVGVDAGGTAAKVRACWADALSAPSPTLRRGAANLNREGLEAVAATLAEGIADAARSARDERRAKAYRLRVAAGVAGAGAEDARRALEDALAEVLRAEHASVPEALCVATDADLVLAAATHGEAGLVAIAGTGSIVLARDARGETHRAGGWGYLLGDDGGGYALGRRALRAALASWENGEATRIADLLAERHALASRDDIVRAVYRDGWPPSKAVPALLRAAEAGDAVALAILRRETRALAEQVARLAASLAPRAPTSLHLAGGLGDEPAYRAALGGTLAQVWPGGTLAEQPVDPLRGALWLAEHGCE